MRNYFELRIKGSLLARYYIAAYVIIVALAAIYVLGFVIPAEPDPVLDGAYLGLLLLRMLLVFLVSAISYFILFFFVKSTVGGLSLNEERFTEDYNFKSYMVVCLRGLFLTVVTCGIYMPWFIAEIVRLFSGGISLKGDKIEFKGDGMTLFSYLALMVLLPSFLFVLLFVGIPVTLKSMPLLVVFSVGLLICISVYYALAAKWIVSFTHGMRRVASTVKGWHFGIFIAGQMLLSLITCGLYYPMALLRIWKYFVSHAVIGEETVEERLGFSMIDGKNYLTVLGQMLLVTITFGIYYPWAYAKIACLLVNQTYLETIEKPSENMPLS